MLRAVERWLAWRYLATRQREGFVSFIAIFSLIGVALGVATLIVVLSVMGGFREQLLGRIIGLNGHLVITARDGGMAQATPELLAKLKAIPGVRSISLTLERQALVTAGNQTRGALVRGARPEDPRRGTWSRRTWCMATSAPSARVPAWSSASACARP